MLNSVVLYNVNEQIDCVLLSHVWLSAVQDVEQQLKRLIDVVSVEDLNE